MKVLNVKFCVLQLEKSAATFVPNQMHRNILQYLKQEQ